MVFEGFLLTERSGEWDEVWVAGVVPDTTTLIARSTVEDGSDWLWTLLKCEVGFLKPPSGVGAARTAPAGVGVDSVNWICAPDHIHQKWNPTPGEMATLKQEAALLGMQLKAIGIQDAQVTGGGGGDAFNLQSLSDVIQELKDMAKKSKDEDKLKKRSHKKKKKTDKKKKKKKRRGSSTSSSGSSRSRSSQSSSRASSSRSSGPLQWKAKAKDRKVKFEEIHAVDREKFKRKGELMAYATKHPGALTAHFLASIYARLLKGRVERSSQLREASVVAWAAQHSGLSEVRDVREVFAHSRSAFNYGSWLWDCAQGQRRLRRRVEFSGFFFKAPEHGCSKPHVFPLPPFCKDRRVVEYTMGDLGEDSFTCIARGVNLVQSALNMLHGGQKSKFDFVSAAHQRIQTRLESGWKDMLMDFTPMDVTAIHEFLKHQEHYAGGGPAIPLGSKGGVPSSAATVDLHSHLNEHFPDLAAQVLEPKLLLLPSRKRPRKIKRGHTWLHSSYPSLVARNVKAGLSVLRKPKQVARHRGRLCLTGAFAVRKDENEDRVITDPAVNQLIDPDKLPRPRFAYIPKLRVTWVPRSGKLLVSKRDARHYFHSLQIGRKWLRWLCGPPISGERGELRYPATRAAPMGFGPSAGWAQGLTDVASLRADIPDNHRLHPDRMAPDTFPIWGSICDDIWAIDHAQDEFDAELRGPGWLSRAEEAWVDCGVQPNHKKTVNGKGGEEVQGYFVHEDDHWVGVSMQKRRKLFQATWYLLSQHVVLIGDVDRLVGKFGFVHSCRPVMRSVFVEAYGWIEWHRSRRLRSATLPDVVWLELMVAALLLPYAHFDLSASYSQRVECTDASMTGIGRAWASMPFEVVQKMAQLCDHPGLYTNLHLPYGIALTEQHVCPLRKLKLPSQHVHWHKIGAPAAPTKIFLGEADAATWAAEDRLRRSSDDGCRFVHPMDSASCVGAFMKGRSASRLLNTRCQRLCAIGISGGHEVFYPWIPSGENPADEPSRRFEVGLDLLIGPPCDRENVLLIGPPCDRENVLLSAPPLDDSKAELEGKEVVIVDPFNHGRLQSKEAFFVHLCSGPFREDDLTAWVERLGHEHGMLIVGIRVDPRVRKSSHSLDLSCNDMFKTADMLLLLSLIHAGRVQGLFVSPPCSTFSAARHKALSGKKHGPRPLRSRRNPWVCLPGRTKREHEAVDIGTGLGLLSIGLMGEARMFGAWVGGETPS
eukprot:symbB.v1.2.041102.t1/scaffold7825.1/size10313/1